MLQKSTENCYGIAANASRLHSEFQQQPLQVTLHLRTEDPAADRRQLAAALKSNSGGDTVVRDAVGSINNSVLRQHALRFLTNPRR